MMRSEQEIEKKIDKALAAKDQPTMGDTHIYLRAVRETLGWVIEEEDEIPGLDDT
jgi:hypothetical protein